MKTYFVDSFTTEKFKGNPAAVCIAETDLDDATMQSIATEIGFSETAFIKQLTADTYSIRFFTPKMEISLCGHATLASSKIIFDSSSLQKVSFINVDNIELKAARSGDKIVMQFPVYDTTAIEVPEAMLAALGIEQAVETRFNTERNIILIAVENAAVLAGLKPDFSALIKSYVGIAGVLVTAPSGTPDFDFQYRYFWPWAGTNEDPVTGGIQTFLTKYWAQKLNKNKLNAFQSSLRTGMMTTELADDKVLIYGDAVTVFEGEFKD